MSIAKQLIETTEAMACLASVDMALWDRHSNTCIEAATEIDCMIKTEDRLRKIIVDLQRERTFLLEALKPFAACADEIDSGREEPTPDNEWAKFRLLVSDYRRAREAFSIPVYQAKEVDMSNWQPIETAPKGERVLVYDGKSVFEAITYPNGKYYDPVYSEWDGEGATHWMPLPEPPKGGDAT